MVQKEKSDIFEYIQDLVEEKVISGLPEEDKELVESGGWIIHIKQNDE